ncbi:hypothetical protein GOP47_0002024 [Adiantum capillus-veneris]|uniref:Uncharacterized protein n=1 Tax=Adiantum capillus-veneris TaxID=13818 RepID=A0A9D4VAQ6_ADICA|nr:hypothetical protein GOP47_0002024 [Adiantum capillus-veneris]
MARHINSQKPGGVKDLQEISSVVRALLQTCLSQGLLQSVRGRVFAATACSYSWEGISNPSKECNCRPLDVDP